MNEAKIAELASQKIIAFAESQNPKIWHQMAMGWNWDNHTAFLNWLIDNPKTDRATILMIYWRDWPNERSKTKKVIEERYHHFYEKQDIAYDPRNDEGTDWIAAFAKREHGLAMIPRTMLEKPEGEQVDYPDGFIEGLPEELFYEIEELYE